MVVAAVLVAGCKPTPSDGPAAQPVPSSAGPSAAEPTGSGCVAAKKKLEECGIAPSAAGLEPCDERVGACIAGQGCEAIRAKTTGCVFE